LASSYAPVLGHLMGAPLAFTTTHRPSLTVRAPGFTAQTPQLPPGVPDVDFGSFYADVFRPFPANQHPVAALSTGTEVINAVTERVQAVDDRADWPAGDYHVLVVGNHGWFTILFNVNGTVPKDPDRDLDGEIAPAVAEAADQGRTLFAATIPQSHDQPSGPLHYLSAERGTVPALLPTHLALGVAERLRAIDLTAAIHMSDLPLDMRFRARLPVAPSIYFTLRPAFIELVPDPDWQEHWGIPFSKISTNVIFRTQWADNRWGRPVVYATIPDLSLGQDGEIDGLAIDSTQTKHLILLSTTNAPNVDKEIQLVVGAGAPQPVLVKRGSRFRSLGREIGAGRAIGDFCTADPWLVDPPIRLTYEQAPAAAPDLPDDFLFGRRQLHHGPDRVIELPISAIRTWHHGTAAVQICMSRPTGLQAGTPHLYWAHSDDIRTGAPRGPWTEIPIASPNGSLVNQIVAWRPHPNPGGAAYPGMAFYWTITDSQPHYSHVATIRQR
jgi:hypothetical protein